MGSQNKKQQLINNNNKKNYNYEIFIYNYR